ncbi:hypothetical protein BDW59DRAFT_177991 [Aspergillus cavernicola]|uniref:RRM domain-containing protein n=1 Tax=Aspergillus cavernicola TaxID=176166 RepID=A0ABR4IR18_9EURO
MNPYTPAFVPGFARQQSQNRAVSQSSNTTTTTQTSPIDPCPADFHSLAPMQAINTTTRIPPRSHGRVQSQPILIPQLPYKSHQTEIISPRYQRTNPSLLRQLNDLAIQDTSESAQVIAEYRQNGDMVTDPSKMPIGSLVDLKKPPNWGVVKISNIPYSITKQEVFQFLGRQAHLITPGNGCAIHIIMERSTAKTMDCYAEFQTPGDAKDAVIRINRIYETGRAPRLGNRHVDVELTDQNELLKDLFPRTKCIVWRNGMPHLAENNDPYCSGFSGFFTSEEIILAIRHAEIPHRSPFCDKCPQRTYESTVSTLHKFPWYAPALYTVHDRNQLFELANRHIQSLVSRIKRVNTVGLDQKLLNDLLQAGLKCPAFNERQKYTLCIHSEISSEIIKFSEIGKWFPFDTLVRMPNFHDEIHMYFVSLISQGSEQKLEELGLRNMYPMDHPTLRSPYGRIWYEWPQSVSGNIYWKTAVNHEMYILSSLVFRGRNNEDMDNTLGLRRVSGESSFSVTPASRPLMRLSPPQIERRHAHAELSSRVGADYYDAHVIHSHRTSDAASISGGVSLNNNSGSPWNQKLLLYPPVRARPAHPHHRITQSSPMCLPSPTTNPWGESQE